MKLLEWIQGWYKSQCDGNWEHMFGIQIYNVDNPGWTVKISLSDTELVDKEFEEIDYEEGEDNWLFCFVKNEVFEGHGSSQKLTELLTIFKNWVEDQ